MKTNYLQFFILLIGFLTIASCKKEETVLLPLNDRLQTALDESRVEAGIKGVSVSIWTKDLGTWKGASGVSHDEVAIIPDMIFGIGSITKTFTATVCLQLQEKNKLDINNPIKTWLPEFKNIDSNTTLKQLLNHESGIEDFVNDESIIFRLQNEPSRFWTPEEVLELVGPPIFEPGEYVSYSSTNYILIGMILEKVTGISYPELIKTRIINPLGLENTYLEGFETVNGTVAHPHLFGNDISSLSRIAIGSASGATGCLVSNTEDLIKFWKGYNNELLTDESLTLAKTFKVANDGTGHGLGLLHFNIDGKEYIGHSGNTVGYSAVSLFSKDQAQIINILINDTRAQYPIVRDALIEELNKQ